jgi:hypothetical protein
MPDLLIIDANEHALAHTARFCDWLREHDLKPEDTYRVEIGDTTMRVHQFAVNDEGRKYVEIVDGQPGPAIRRPFDVQLKSRPNWLEAEQQ